MWNKRVKAHLILIFSTNTNCESMAYRSFRPSGFEARGVRKVTVSLYTSLCVTYSVDYDHASRARRLLTIRLASWSLTDQATRLCPPNCGDALKPSNTKPVEPIGGWPSRELGYGNSVEGCTWVIRSQASASNGPEQQALREEGSSTIRGWVGAGLSSKI